MHLCRSDFPPAACFSPWAAGLVESAREAQHALDSQAVKVAQLKKETLEISRLLQDLHQKQSSYEGKQNPDVKGPVQGCHENTHGLKMAVCLKLSKAVEHQQQEVSKASTLWQLKYASAINPEPKQFDAPHVPCFSRFSHIHCQ